MKINNSSNTLSNNISFSHSSFSGFNDAMNNVNCNEMEWIVKHNENNLHLVICIANFILYGKYQLSEYID